MSDNLKDKINGITEDKLSRGGYAAFNVVQMKPIPKFVAVDKLGKLKTIINEKELDEFVELLESK